MKSNPTLNIKAGVLANQINSAYWSDENTRPKGNINFRKIRDSMNLL